MSNARSVAPVFSKRRIEEVAIAYNGRFATVSVEVLPGGILVQRDNAIWEHPGKDVPKEKIRGGTVWIRNRDLDRRSDGETKYVRCNDLYEALRLCIHTSNGYGVQTPSVGSEAETLKNVIAMARATDKLPGSAKAGELQKLTSTFAKNRDLRKGRARDWYIKAIETIRSDALGRRNPSGARMRVGAAIDQVLLRLQDLANLDRSVDRRAHAIYEYIENILRGYDALWNDLSSLEKLEDRGKIAKMLSLMGNTFDQKQRIQATEELRNILMGHEERLSPIRGAPFCRNVHHTTNDLSEAITLCDPATLPELRVVFARLREGIRWVYPLAYLNVMVLFPLSVLLERQKLLCREKNRQLKKEMRFSFKEYLAEFSPHFEQTLRDIDEFESKLGKCTDDNLVKPVKNSVLACVAAAKEAAEAKKWLDVRKHLKLITSTIL